MSRNPCATAPDPASAKLVRTFDSLPVVAWGAQAMAYLGVPIVIGVDISF